MQGNPQKNLWKMYSLSTAVARDIEERLCNKQVTTFYHHFVQSAIHKKIRRPRRLTNQNCPKCPTKCLR